MTAQEQIKIQAFNLAISSFTFNEDGKPETEQLIKRAEKIYEFITINDEKNDENRK